MKKFLKGIVWFLTAFVVVVVAGGYLLPAHVLVRRQAVIAAPPDTVFAIVGSFKRFQEWSPWAALDPNTTYKLEGPETGIGEKLSWASNSPQVGVGSQTVTQYVPGSRMEADLDLGNMGKAAAFWDVKPDGPGTVATWGFTMKLDGVLDRWTGLLMDRVIGPDYDKGLQNVKALAEKEAAGG